MSGMNSIKTGLNRIEGQIIVATFDILVALAIAVAVISRHQNAQLKTKFATEAESLAGETYVLTPSYVTGAPLTWAVCGSCKTLASGAIC